MSEETRERLEITKSEAIVVLFLTIFARDRGRLTIYEEKLWTRILNHWPELNTIFDYLRG